MTSRGILICLPVLFLTGCLPDSKNCWSAETKQSVTSLFGKIAGERMVALARKAIQNFSEADRHIVKDGVKLTLEDYYSISSDYVTGALRCGANMKITWTRRDGKVFTARDRLVEFNIYKAETPGKVFFVTNESGPITATLRTMFDPDDD